jgi:hypothetical protein
MQPISFISSAQGLSEAAHKKIQTTPSVFTHARPIRILETDRPNQSAGECEDSAPIKQSKLEVIAVSLATLFIFAAATVFTWNLTELIKVIDRSISIYMQTQLWIPR